MGLGLANLPVTTDRPFLSLVIVMEAKALLAFPLTMWGIIVTAMDHLLSHEDTDIVGADPTAAPERTNPGSDGSAHVLGSLDLQAGASAVD